MRPPTSIILRFVRSCRHRSFSVAGNQGPPGRQFDGEPDDPVARGAKPVRPRTSGVGSHHAAHRRASFGRVERQRPSRRPGGELSLQFAQGRSAQHADRRRRRCQVDAKNPDLFLGKAYGAIGPLRIPTNFFILERLRVGLTDYAKR